MGRGTTPTYYLRHTRKCQTRLDSFQNELHAVNVTSRELLKILKSRGCVEVNQEGSHLKIRCGTCTTTVPVHKGEDIGRGLLRAIERQLEPCLGKGWLKRR